MAITRCWTSTAWRAPGVEMLAVHFFGKNRRSRHVVFATGATGASGQQIGVPAARNADESWQRGAVLRCGAAHYVMHYLLAAGGAIVAGGIALRCPQPHVAAKQVMADRQPPQMVALLAAASVLKLSLGGPTSIYASGLGIGDGRRRPLRQTYGAA